MERRSRIYFPRLFWAERCLGSREKSSDSFLPEKRAQIIEAIALWLDSRLDSWLGVGWTVRQVVKGLNPFYKGTAHRTIA